MDEKPPMLKEIRSAQYLGYASIMLVLIDTGIITAIYWNQVLSPGGIIPPLLNLVYCMFVLVLLWQLGKRRAWARKSLVFLAYLNIIGFGGLIVQIALTGPIQGSVFYRIYYYGVRLINAMICAYLSYYLTMPSVREAYQRHRSRPSATNHL